MIDHIIKLFTRSTEHFIGQEEGEVVLAIARQHLFTVVTPFILILLAAFLPLFLKIAFATQIVTYELSDIFLFVSSLWYSFLWIASFYVLMIYSLNTLIVTNKRIVENYQTSFFNRRISEIDLFRIQDIAVQIRGFVETFLSIGTLAIQSAAERREFVFKRVANPERIKDIIMQAVLLTHREGNSGASSPVHNLEA